MTANSVSVMRCARFTGIPFLWPDKQIARIQRLSVIAPNCRNFLELGTQPVYGPGNRRVKR
jgi:hypothetical protein